MNKIELRIPTIMTHSAAKLFFSII